MSTIMRDDRTKDERFTHSVGIVSTCRDTDPTCYIVWACRPQDIHECYKKVYADPDLYSPRMARLQFYRAPRHVGHVHIRAFYPREEAP